MNDSVRCGKDFKHLKIFRENALLIYHKGLVRDSTTYLFQEFFHNISDLTTKL